MGKVTNDKYLRVAKINGIFGLGGWLKLYPYAGFDQLAMLKNITLADEKSHEIVRETKVDELNTASGKARIKLSGVSTPEAAEELSGLEIWVERAKFKLKKDEYPVQDLMGCEVIYNGEVIGVVDGIYTLAQDVLEVKLTGSSDTVLIPMVESFVLDVDIEHRKVVVDRVDELR